MPEHTIGCCEILAVRTPKAITGEAKPSKRHFCSSFSDCKILRFVGILESSSFLSLLFLGGQKNYWKFDPSRSQELLKSEELLISNRSIGLMEV